MGKEEAVAEMKSDSGCSTGGLWLHPGTREKEKKEQGWGGWDEEEMDEQSRWKQKKGMQRKTLKENALTPSCLLRHVPLGATYVTGQGPGYESTAGRQLEQTNAFLSSMENSVAWRPCP